MSLVFVCFVRFGWHRNSWLVCRIIASIRCGMFCSTSHFLFLYNDYLYIYIYLTLAVSILLVIWISSLIIDVMAVGACNASKCQQVQLPYHWSSFICQTIFHGMTWLYCITIACILYYPKHMLYIEAYNRPNLLLCDSNCCHRRMCSVMLLVLVPQWL